jgi:hypothetical protein
MKLINITTPLLQRRKQLKGKNVAIAEHLTTRRAALLKQANSVVASGKLLSAWSKDGKITVKSPTNRIAQITSEADFNQFL